MSTDTHIEIAYARAYALLRAAGASDQATFDIAFARAHGELLAGFPEQQAQIVEVLLQFARHLGRTAVRRHVIEPV